MNETPDSALRHAMRPVAGPPLDDWQTVLRRADRVQQRARMIQRLVVVAFVALLGVAFVSVGGEAETAIVDPATAPDDVVSTDTVSNGHVFLGLLMLAVLGGAFLAAARRRAPSPRSKALPWLTVPMVLYPLATASIIRFETGNAVIVLAVILKILVILGIPILLFFVAKRIRERPSRAGAATATWIGVGFSMVLLARGFIDDIIRWSNESSTFRLWPVDLGHNSDSREIGAGLSDAPGSDWTAANILRTELVAVIVIASLIGALLVLLRREPVLAVPGVVVAAFLLLFGYNAVAPLAAAYDYDPFLGDIALGSVTYELVFAFFPYDIVGSIALGAAGLSLSALLWLWGGPMPRERPQ